VVQLTVQWTERALAQLQETAAYIALENPEAATRLVRRVLASTDRLERFPRSGRRLPEFPAFPHRELVVPPCRVIYRVEGFIALVLFVTRSERILRRSHLGN
jgi:plasmid stabilization system protein ParE